MYTHLHLGIDNVLNLVRVLIVGNSNYMADASLSPSLLSCTPRSTGITIVKPFSACNET